jgi:hypothetical protein
MEVSVRRVQDFRTRALNTVNEFFQFEAVRRFEDTRCFCLIICICRLAQPSHFSGRPMLIL